MIYEKARKHWVLPFICNVKKKKTNSQEDHSCSLCKQMIKFPPMYKHNTVNPLGKKLFK